MVKMAPKSEIRAVFVASVSFLNADWDLIAQTCKDYGVNTLIIEGGTGYMLREDVIARAITACHARGMELHVSLDLLISPQPEHSEMWSVNSSLEPWNWVCPTKEASRVTIKDIVQRLTSYDIDGFMFDYIRYNIANICYCPECKTKFEEYLGETIIDWPGEFAGGGLRYNEFMEWRVIPITELVRDIRNWLLTIKSDLTISAASFTVFADASPHYWRYFIGQDTADWINKGYLDFVAPMMYTTNLTEIQDYTQADFKYLVGGPEGKIPLVCFVATYFPGTEPFDPTAFKAVIDRVRELGADGWAIWRYGGPGEGAGSPAPDIRNYLSIIDMPLIFSLSEITWVKTDSDLKISWRTNLPVISRVEYSTSPLFVATKKPWFADPTIYYWDIDHVLGSIIEDLTVKTSHTITIPLTPDTDVYFRVQSEDGTTATSPTYYSGLAPPTPIDGKWVLLGLVGITATVAALMWYWFRK